MMQRTHILVFDSGAGGLTIATDIVLRYPEAKLSYLIDAECFPYGDLPSETLLLRLNQFLVNKIEQLKPDVVVIACNTASTIALASLRTLTSIPIVGVVPAIKPAAEMTTSGIIGLLATPATVTRDYTQQLIRDFAPNNKVLLHGSTKLVALAELKLDANNASVNIFEQVQQELTAWLSQDTSKGMDIIILACTHFPLLREEIQRCIPASITLIDSSLAIVNRVNYWLEALDGPRHKRAHTDISVESLTQNSKYSHKCDQYRQYLLSYKKMHTKP